MIIERTVCTVFIFHCISDFHITSSDLCLSKSDLHTLSCSYLSCRVLFWIGEVHLLMVFLATLRRIGVCPFSFKSMNFHCYMLLILAVLRCSLSSQQWPKTIEFLNVTNCFCWRYF